MADLPLEQLVDEMLCPNALLGAAEASLSRCADGMWHCGLCGRTVLLRWGRVSLHARSDDEAIRDALEESR